MKKTVVIDSIFDYERTALLENGELKEIIFQKKDGLNIGDIIVGKVKKILTGKFIFIDIGDEKTAFLCLNDKKEKNLFYFNEEKNKLVLNVKEGDDIIVQVLKSGTDLKGITVTSRLTLTGKYCVLLINEKHLGISKKIKDDVKDLKQTVKEILPEDYGIILRTNCKDISAEILKQEILYMIEKSKKILETASFLKPPSILYLEKRECEKIIIDLLKKDDEIFLNSESLYNKFKESEIFENINFYDENLPIFEVFSIESKLEKIFNNKIWLKSGAFIIIEVLEAMTIIDVNTGKNIKKDYEEMVLKTNLEAVIECAKQIRLRNLSGMILIDFIDMQKDEHKKIVFNEMKKISKEDRQPITIYPINELGIMQLTRKKGLKPLYEMIMKHCPNCQGFGKIKNEVYISNQIKNKIISILSNTIYNNIVINCNSKVIDFLKKSLDIEILEKKYNAKIQLNTTFMGKFDYFEIEKSKK